MSKDLQLTLAVEGNHSDFQVKTNSLPLILELFEHFHVGFVDHL